MVFFNSFCFEATLILIIIILSYKQMSRYETLNVSLQTDNARN